MAHIDAPDGSHPYAGTSAAYLQKLIQGKNVEVRYTQRDAAGQVLGVVVMKTQGKTEDRSDSVDVNLLMVREGMAWQSSADHAPEYAEAELSAKQSRRGLWSSDDADVCRPRQ